MEENLNTNPVPTTPVEEQPVETINESVVVNENPVPTTPVEEQPVETPNETVVVNENPVPTSPAEGQPTAPVDSETTTVTTEEPTTETTLEESTEPTAETPVETSTSTPTEETTVSNTATGPNMRVTADSKMEIASDGTISIDGHEATNEQLQEYFDYTKYSDKNAARMVEGIFKSDTVTINGVTFNAELNENGEMVSIDGTKKLTQEEIKSYFGEKGYEALVCKTTKDISIDENGTINIKDREEKVRITIAQPPLDTTPNAAANNSSSQEGGSVQDKLKDPTAGVGATGGSGGYSGGGGGYSGGGGGGGYSDGGSSKPDDEEIEEAGTPVIMVEFGKIEAIRDDILALKAQLKGVCDDYGNTINGLSSNGTAWSGVDKDAYIQQKKGYVTNIGQVSTTLDQFASYLDTCVNNYKQLESELAAKEIS